MRAWFAQLSRRDRQTLGAGAVMASLLLAYVLVWQPFHAWHRQLQAQAAQQQALRDWMQQAAAEVQRLRGAVPISSARADTDESLLSRIDRSLRGSGLPLTGSRLQPGSGDSVDLEFTEVEFNPLLAWLQQLAAIGVQAHSLSVERLDAPGRVRARLNLH